MEVGAHGLYMASVLCPVGVAVEEEVVPAATLLQLMVEDLVGVASMTTNAAMNKIVNVISIKTLYGNVHKGSSI